ncbi:MAG: glycosyltransferase family 2 protein [Erysipelotrichales bacterium]|nr:glycosyltransferase family 2 protein [Erysipelotrichales bacterium]
MNSSNKILTVSVAAYNVSAYIRKNLDSCIVPEIMDDLEVIVVDDGSKDNTAQIVQEYVDRYPNTFRLISKENGGYGTTVNQSVAAARGKYFKILDGDDWFDPAALKHLIELARSQNADWIVTRYTEVIGEDGPATELIPKWEQYEGRTVKINEVQGIFSVGMWPLTVKTDLLRKVHLQLPPHTLYTDQIFAVSTLPIAEDVLFDSASVYQYRLGRDGQSVSPESRIKHFDDTCRVFDILLDIYLKSGEKNHAQMVSRLERYYYALIRTIFLMKPSADNKKLLQTYEERIKKEAPEIYALCPKRSKKVLLMRMTNYLAYYLFAGREKNWS